MKKRVEKENGPGIASSERLAINRIPWTQEGADTQHSLMVVPAKDHFSEAVTVGINHWSERQMQNYLSGELHLEGELPVLR